VRPFAMPKTLFRKPPTRRRVAVALAGALVVAGLTGVLETAQVTSAPEAAAAVGDNPQDEAAALAQAHDSGHRVEVASERTEVKTIWANPDGTLSSETAATPIRVRADDGSWTSVDSSLTTDDGRLAPRASSTDVSFSATGSGPLAVLDPPGKTSLAMGFADELDAPAVRASSATYPVSGTDPSKVQFSATANGFNARVLLDSAPQQAPTYTFPLTLTGLTPTLKDDVLSLSDAKGTEVARSAPLSMWDSSTDKAGDRANQVPVESKLVTGADGSKSLVLTPSMEWLSDPGTVYPVTVDPDIATTNMYGDSYISSATADKDTNYVSDYRIRVGSPDGTTKFRGIETFVTADYNGRDITAASLKLYQYYGITCTSKTVNVYPSKTRIRSAEVTWTSQSPSTSAEASVVDDRWKATGSFNAGNSTASPPCDNAWQSLDVAKMVNAMAAGEIANSSFVLQAANETDAQGDQRFCSANPESAPSTSTCSNTAHVPVLSVSYWPSLGVQSWYSMTSHPLNDRSTLKVNNDNGNAVVQAQDVKLNGRGLDLSIDRFYNSQATGTTSLGTGGWSLSVGPDVYLEATADSYRFDYVAPGGTRFGQFVRKSTSSSNADYKKFLAPIYGGLDADLADNGNDSAGLSTFTMTFHSSQLKYVFKKVDSSSNNLYLAEMKDRSGNSITFNYATGTHQLTSITDSSSRSIAVTWTSGRITQITSTTKAADGTTDVTRTWKYGYTGTVLTSYTDPANQVVQYAYTDGALTKVTDPVNASTLAPTTTLIYGPGSAVKQVTYSRAAGNVVFFFQYFTPADDDGDTSVCPGSPNRWSKVTDLTTGDDAYGKGPTYCFTDRKNATENASIHVVDALGNDKGTSYTADNQGDTSTTAGNAGAADGSTVNKYATDLPDQLSSVTEPKDDSDSAAGTTTYGYDNASTSDGGKWLPMTQADSSGKCSTYKYDGKGRTSDSYTGFASTSGDASGCTAGSGAAHFHKEYNDDGSINYSYDGNGSHNTGEYTNYTYWAVGDTGYVAGTVGQLKTVVKPGGSCTTGSRHLCTSYTYDGAGRTASVTDGRSKVTRYSYDKLDRVYTAQFDGAGCATSDTLAGNCVKYDYDAEGNMTIRQDKAGTTTFSYDQMNRQTKQVFPGGASLTFSRDGAGNLKTYQQDVYSTGDLVTYTYDVANRPSLVTDSTGTFSIYPDKDGRPSQITYPVSTGVIGSYRYTKSGKPDTIAYAKTGAGNLVAYDYSYKDGSKQTDKLRTEKVTGSISALGADLSYTYNDSEQLESVDDAQTGGKDYTYGFDKGGNLTKATVTGSSNTYNGYDRAGELCWTGTGSSAPSSQLATSCPATPSGYTAHTSDDAGNDLGTSASPNVYNSNSQATSVAGVAQGYLDLGNDLRMSTGSKVTISGPLGVTAQNSSGGGVTFYTRDPSGNLLGEHGYGGTHYFLADYQGSVSALISTSGGVDGSYTYDPYGKTTVNAQSGGTTAAANPWRYTGGYQDLEGAGYYHFGARYYDSAGHFIQPDALQGSIEDPSTINSYGYTGGDPVNRADPSGAKYVKFGFEVCDVLCVSGGLGTDHFGDVDPFLALSAGPAWGFDAFMGGGSGSNEGWSDTETCGVAPGVYGEGSINGRQLGGGGRLGAELGCTVGLEYTF
jgi:RHS repeat-associated protein